MVNSVIDTRESMTTKTRTIGTRTIEARTIETKTMETRTMETWTIETMSPMEFNLSDLLHLPQRMEGRCLREVQPLLGVPQPER